MQFLPVERYRQLREGAQVLEADSHGDKVLRLRDGTFLKLFRLKRLLSSALLRPYARRFASNTTHLQRLGIPCPKVIELYRMTDPRRDVVHYAPLPGVTLRQLREQTAIPPAELRAQLGRFIAGLHQQGVYFRSLHLGNIVLTPDGELGLIDIADLQCQRRPLRIGQRQRNFRHLLRDAQDLVWLRQDNSVLQAYREASGLNFPVAGLKD